MTQAANWAMPQPQAQELTQQDWATNYDLGQKVTKNKVFSQNLDPQGNLNMEGFYRDASGAGLSPEATLAAIQYYSAQKQADLATQQTNMMLRYYGADPSAAGRNGASIGPPGVAMVPNPQAGAPTAGTDAQPTTQPSMDTGTTNRLLTAEPPPVQAQGTPPSMQAPGQTAAPGPQGFAGMFASMKAQAQAARQAPAAQPPSQNSQALAQLFGMQPRPAANGNLQAPGPDDSAGSQDIQGQVQITPPQEPNTPTAPMQLPAPVVTQSPTIPVQLPDTRDARQKVEDSYDPSKGPMAFMQDALGNLANGGALAMTTKTPAPILQSAATTLARMHYDNDGTVDGVNQALGSYMNDKVAAIGPPPMIPPIKDGVPDTAALMNQQREWQGKVQGVSLAVHQDLGDSYGKQFDQSLAASSIDMAVKKMLNDVATQNADLAGKTKLAAGISSLIPSADPVIGGVKLDPTTFGSAKELQDFNNRAAAYGKLGNAAPPTDLPSLIAWSKNFSVAEGLGQTEGMQHLLTLVGAPDLASKLQVVLASGAKMDAPTLASLGVQNVLGGGVDMSQLKSQMAFTGEYRAHATGSTGEPTMQAGGQSVQPYTQTPTQALGSALGTRGSRTNPIPEGQEPPIGAWYIYKGRIIQRLR